MNNIDDLKNLLPDYAKDIKLNLSSVLSEKGSAGLTESQIAGIALTSAITCQNDTVVDHLKTAQQDIAAEQIQACHAASSIMTMNNIYYRFTHSVTDKEYSQMPAGLRMMVIGKPGIDKIDFELFCLAASCINGCQMCMDAHSNSLVQLGLSKTAVQSCAKIAAVIHAVCKSV